MTGYLRGTIVKPSPESGDFYVVWSDCTDGPAAWGSRADLAPLLEGEDAAARFARADATGSSALWPSADDPHLRFGEGLIYDQRGWLVRENLTALCERLTADQTDPCTDLLRPFHDETEVRAP